MLCQNCQKNEANTHIKSTVGGETTERFLCFECYAKLAHNSLTESFDLGFGSFLNKIFSGENLLAEKSEIKKCPKCSTTYNTIATSGKVGCEKCYEYFADEMKSSLQKIHGKVRHVGKRPKSKDGEEDE